MLFVKVPKEIEEYQPKILFNLSSKQLFWGGIGIGTGLAVYLIGSLFIPTSILSYIVMACVTIPFLCGFIPIHDMPADQYFRILINFHKKKAVKLKYMDFSDGGGLINETTVSPKEAARRQRIDKKEQKFRKKYGWLIEQENEEELERTQSKQKRFGKKKNDPERISV